MSIPELQLLVLALTGGAMLSAAWLVSHARDVVLVLRHFFPLDPGEGQRLTSPKSVCAALTLFGFSISAEVWVMIRAGEQL